VKQIALPGIGEFWYGDYKEPFEQLEGAVPGHPVGVLLKDDDGKPVCAYCGKAFDNLGQHTRHTHGLHAREYKDAVGLLHKSALVSERLRAASIRGSQLRRIKYGAPKIAPRRQTASELAMARHAAHWSPEILNRTGRCYAQVLATARAVQREHGRVTRHLMHRRGIYDRTIEVYFGSWQHLQRLLGVPEQRRQWTRQELLVGLRSLAEKLGRTPAQSDLRRYGLPTDKPYRRTFGSYAAACEAAGLPVNIPVPAEGDEAIRALNAYAVTGTFKKAAAISSVGSPAIAKLFARYGCPYPPFGGNPQIARARREWAAEMARRLAGTASESAAA
jgi:hypothetical protein